MHYDLLVIGNGPAARQGALAAAKMRKRVAIVAPIGRTNGEAGPDAGNMRSKTVREAIQRLSADRQRELDGDSDRTDRWLDESGVDRLTGEARFISDHEVEINGPDGVSVVRADRFLIAAGTRAKRPGHVPFDGKLVFDSDQVLELDRIPNSMIVVGGGATGIEYATLFAALGVEVTVVDGRERLLEACDREVVETLLDRAESLGVVFRLGEDVIGVDRLQDETVAVYLESGERLSGETALFCVGRVGNTEHLNLQAAGLEPDEHGRLWCNEEHQTWASHIYGAGDVVGFPEPAGIRAEQVGRIDDFHELNFDDAQVPEPVDAEEAHTV